MSASARPAALGVPSPDAASQPVPAGKPAIPPDELLPSVMSREASAQKRSSTRIDDGVSNACSVATWTAA